MSHFAKCHIHHSVFVFIRQYRHYLEYEAFSVNQKKVCECSIFFYPVYFICIQSHLFSQALKLLVHFEPCSGPYFSARMLNKWVKSISFKLLLWLLKFSSTFCYLLLWNTRPSMFVSFYGAHCMWCVFSTHKVVDSANIGSIASALRRIHYTYYDVQNYTNGKFGV